MLPRVSLCVGGFGPGQSAPPVPCGHAVNECSLPPPPWQGPRRPQPVHRGGPGRPRPLLGPAASRGRPGMQWPTGFVNFLHRKQLSTLPSISVYSRQSEPFVLVSIVGGFFFDFLISAIFFLPAREIQHSFFLSPALCLALPSPGLREAIRITCLRAPRDHTPAGGCQHILEAA